MTLLNGFLENWLVAAIGAPLILLLLLFLFVRDMRRIGRGEPIKIWYLPGKIYPGDPGRRYAVMIYLGPYIAVFGAVIMLLAAIVFVRIFSPQA